MATAGAKVEGKRAALTAKAGIAYLLRNSCTKGAGLARNLWKVARKRTKRFEFFSRAPDFKSGNRLNLYRWDSLGDSDDISSLSAVGLTLDFRPALRAAEHCMRLTIAWSGLVRVRAGLGD